MPVQGEVTMVIVPTFDEEDGAELNIFVCECGNGLFVQWPSPRQDHQIFDCLECEAQYHATERLGKVTVESTRTGLKPRVTYKTSDEYVEEIQRAQANNQAYKEFRQALEENPPSQAPGWMHPEGDNPLQEAILAGQKSIDRERAEAGLPPFFPTEYEETLRYHDSQMRSAGLKND